MIFLLSPIFSTFLIDDAASKDAQIEPKRNARQQHKSVPSDSHPTKAKQAKIFYKSKFQKTNINSHRK